jgi:hypothetical protein
MPFTRTRAVMVAGLALLSGAAMYSDAMAQGLPASPALSHCFRQNRGPFFGQVVCQQYRPSPFEHTQTFQSPFRAPRRPPGSPTPPPR